MNPDTNPHPASIVQLLQQLRDEGMTLLSQEVALAKAEITDKLSEKAGQAIKLAVGGMIAYAGLIVLLLGAGDLLAFGLRHTGMDPEVAVWLGRTVVGLLIAIVGAVMLARAKHAFAKDTLVPEQTLASLEKNKNWGRAKLHSVHESVA
ncbi:phage holin family protein [Horticoccus luteus]|uniref:Phage holin family protein n=1 Tax=Horticoccus luteus TaxID=2862869 RepID=A0A8F9TY68_9BACT|nr:phage holin family protein [Horticoccus luteus]QYM79923.1 phage holin family protein [Horticoccus luteus]